MEIVGLCGKKGSGKDTAADVLVEKHGFTKVSLATPLKLMTQNLFGIHVSRQNSLEEKEKPFIEPLIINKSDIHRIASYCEGIYPSGIITDNQVHKMELIGVGTEIHSIRELLQFVGTNLVRDVIDGDFWVKVFDSYLQNLNTDKVVVPDVRFRNERTYLLSKNSTLLLIDRPNNTLSDTHVSENSLDDGWIYDYTITNNSSVSSFEKLVDIVYSFNKELNNNVKMG